MNAKLSSESVEHFTPRAIVDAAREVMEVIELDPATCVEANRMIRARAIYTKKENGLAQQWRGRTLLNPPGGLCDDRGHQVIRKSKASGEPGCTVSGSCGLEPGHKHSGVTSQAVTWWIKLAKEYRAYRVECAVFIGFTMEILQSTQGIDTGVPLDFPLCFPSERMRFLSEQGGVFVPGEQPTHANVIVYLPPRWDPKGARFEEVFSKFGRVRL
jgi:hypothetical protein